jgi:hypothetical protein
MAKLKKQSQPKLKKSIQRIKNDSPMVKLKNSKPTENKGHQAKQSQRIKNDSPMAKIKNSKTNEIKKQSQTEFKETKPKDQE